ncbi:serine hydrolase [Sinomonas gamaensis]|uniref:serine hydrolase n=1 Tax=Sinomonas gamaensis TaxID=2565624 RepID=UPI00308448B3
MAPSAAAPPYPATRAMRSTTDWEVLAWLVERLRGKPLAEVLDADVFDPSGMASSLVAVPGQPPEPMLHGYVVSGGTRVDLTRDDAFAGSGDAGVLSTVVDMDRSLAALTTGKLLSQESWKLMAAGEPYEVGMYTADLCPVTRHVLASGGGGPYAILSAATEDGRQQVSVTMALPSSPLDSARVPALVQRMEEALHAKAAAMCR